MNTILVPVGSPRKALNTLQYAIDLVQGTNVKIYLVKAYGVTKVAGSLKNMDDFLEAEANRDLENVVAHVDKKGVEIISKSISGDAKEIIKRIAKQLEIDLIIAGSKSDKKIFIGKTPGYLIKNTDLPVLFVPRNYQFKKINTILMAIKSGVISRRDLMSPLKDILNLYKSKLELLRVITADSTEEDAILDSELSKLKSNYFTSENETIYEGLKENIDKVSPDLICVIRRKRGFFKRLWENDKIYKKDFESKLPLLVLKGSE
ncbi:universal stress protein [Aureibaculum sp. 2210JD6-5]|uniref:universal stress protein n=1 Tax=Aureibaculum sp. 2210JD6-5 TaxID=3103957 RepID=UPI002AAE27CF|nr:universal stress protein [Aureibaculum sp. 2210JD6-5]MDY7394786.1 universal stress protein [Aureibaculum sp. 2210JD6-5]